jgi:bifunctional dethiobiotin synthetase / adenosylmethionine---8-amino-7-oxononanoate aminotransferase
MDMIDPLFQRVLVKECKNQKIPVIFDEVFTGFWRLGTQVIFIKIILEDYFTFLTCLPKADDSVFQSASELLGCLPDIACYAKLMTGGIVPLAATLSTEEIFESFKSDSKVLFLNAFACRGLSNLEIGHDAIPKME